MLQRPDTPVISLKLFTAAFKSYLASQKSPYQTDFDKLGIDEDEVEK